MSKASKVKTNKSKSHLTPEEKKQGLTHVYIIVAMIVIGIVIGLYNLQ